MHPNGLDSKHYSNINDLLQDAVDEPRTLLANSKLGAQLDFFAKSGESKGVYDVLKILGAQCPQELEASDFLEGILCVLRNGPMFNLCFGNMKNVQSSGQFIDSCSKLSPDTLTV